MEGRQIFQDDADRNDFLSRLKVIIPDTSARCYAWALVPNHAHLLLRTGKSPMSTVMQRILTGYVLAYNARHKRQGKLFQNRYKSILCQEEAYFLELVRYIHLNPFRSGLVSDLPALEHYRYGGHSVIMGNRFCEWLDRNTVLSHFGETRDVACRKYAEFIRDGVGQGERPDLEGGVLVRGAAGWKDVEDIDAEVRIHSDERILGDSDFVEAVLRDAQEQMERHFRLKAEGYDLGRLCAHFGPVFGVEPADIMKPGKYRARARARSVVCYFAVRELGITGSDLARDMDLTPQAISEAVKRGEKTVIEQGITLP
jgi:putative transposase